MPERPEYAAGIRRKRAAYEANGLPVMFIHPHDLHGRAWSDELLGRIWRPGT